MSFADLKKPKQIKKYKHTHPQYVELLSDLICETTNDGRRYQTPEGLWYPSITTVLQEQKKNAPALVKWNKENPHGAARAATRGDRVHTLIENLLNNEPTKPVGGDFFTYQKFEKVLSEHVDNIEAQEVMLYSDQLKIAGRCDLIAEWDGERAIIDFKTSTKKKRLCYIKDYQKQIAGYAKMLDELVGQRIGLGVNVIVCDTGETQVFPYDPWVWLEKLQSDIDYFYKHNKTLNLST